MQLLFRILLHQNNNTNKTSKSKEVPVALENDNNHNRVGKKTVTNIQAAEKNNGNFSVSKENHNHRTREKTVKLDLPGPEPLPATRVEVVESDFKRLRSSNNNSVSPTSSSAKGEEKKEKATKVEKEKKSKKEEQQLQVKHEEEKKCYTNPKKDKKEEPKKEVPKLKIDLPNMKSQLVEEERKQPKLILKLPSPIDKLPHSTLPLEEYAKKIGLQPVQKKSHDEPHKKRKKKHSKDHSKEPNKKRKLHAEVQSLTLNDEVKLKVKITHKEKRSSSTDERLTLKDVEMPLPSLLGQNTQTPEEVKATSLLRAVRKPMVFIPNPPKISSDSGSESDMISEIVNRMKQPTPAKAMSPPVAPSSSKQMQPPKPKSTASPAPPSPKPISVSPKPRPQLAPPPPPKPVPQQTAKPQVPVLMPQFSQASMFDIRMQRMNSPSPRMFSSPRPPMQRLPMMRPAIKRASNDMSHMGPGNKTPRLDLMEISAQNRLMKKPMYASIIRPEQRPQKPMADISKKLPRIIAPSSISVTKVGDTQSVNTVQQMNRPAVEILKIPSSAPTADKNPANLVGGPKPKANRPPPAPIPLDRIRKSLHGMKSDQALDLSSPKPTAALRPDLASLDMSRSDTVQSVRRAIDSLRAAEASSNGNGEKITSTTTMTTSKSSSVRKMDTPVIDLTDSSSEPQKSATTEKKAAAAPPMVRPPMPKLKPVRQQNMSVRTVPNPSALFMRNQTQASIPTAKSMPKSMQPSSKLSEKIQQLHQLQNQRKITPED